MWQQPWTRTHAEVFIYDSIYESVDKATLDTMKQLFGDISVKVAGGPKQEGVTDCGLFAIATCVALANGQQPYNYLQSCMRSHLINCIENGKLVVFPSI